MWLRGLEGIMKEKLELNEKEWEQAMKRYGPLRSRAQKVTLNEVDTSQSALTVKKMALRRQSTVLNIKTAKMLMN